MEQARSTPRYLSLADDLRSQINRGELAPGDRLPSEAELANQYGFSRGTVVKAIELLVSEGVVNRQQGSGSFVSKRSLHRRAGRLLSFAETAHQDGHRTEQKLLSIEKAEPSVAREFGAPPQSMDMKRLRTIDGTACTIHHSIIPHSVYRRFFESKDEREALFEDPDFSLYALFEEIGFPVHEARERVTARLGDEREIELLGMEKGAPVIVVFRMSYAENGELLEAVEAIYRADYYTYDTHLIRGNVAPGGRIQIASSNERF